MSCSPGSPADEPFCGHGVRSPSCSREGPRPGAATHRGAALGRLRARWGVSSVQSSGIVQSCPFSGVAREGHARQSSGERYGPLVLEGRPLLPGRLRPEGRDGGRAHRTLESGLGPFCRRVCAAGLQTGLQVSCPRIRWGPGCPSGLPWAGRHRQPLASGSGLLSSFLPGRAPSPLLMACLAVAPRQERTRPPAPDCCLACLSQRPLFLGRAARGPALGADARSKAPFQVGTCPLPWRTGVWWGQAGPSLGLSFLPGGWENNASQGGGQAVSWMGNF